MVEPDGNRVALIPPTVNHDLTVAFLNAERRRVCLVCAVS